MKILILFVCLIGAKVTIACTPSATTCKGTHAPAQFCSGDLIFEDEFHDFDLRKWGHAVTMAGGGNYEFQWVVNSRNNTYAKDGILHIRPTLTADDFHHDFVTSGTVEIPEWEW